LPRRSTASSSSTATPRARANLTRVCTLPAVLPLSISLNKDGDGQLTQREAAMLRPYANR
jgi:hypothetical protein